VRLSFGGNAGEGALVDVESHPQHHDGTGGVIGGGGGFHQEAAALVAVDEHVIGPLERRGRGSDRLGDRFADGQPAGQSEKPEAGGRKRLAVGRGRGGMEDDREGQVLSRLRAPASSVAPAACRLVLRRDDGAFGRAVCGPREGALVGGAEARVPFHRAPQLAGAQVLLRGAREGGGGSRRR